MGSKTETEFHVPEREPGETTEQTATEIYGYDSMEPFLMTLVSDSDLWMYVSSLGSLTAGRIDEDHSLFPYCVEDIVHRSAGRTGPTTVLRVWQKGDTFEIWEPFASPANSDGLIRKLSKTVLGNRIAFEETHERLGLTFRYEWTPSDRFGFVRTAEIVNNRHRPVRVDVVDGLLNLIPAGITYQFTQRMSVLVDAYTECEVDPITGVTTVSLASLIVDKPEPGEALFASAVWSRGLEGSTILLSQDQLTAFRQGNPVTSEVSLKGRRGNYLISASLNLEPGDLRTWDIVADTGLSQAQVEALRAFLIDEPQPRHVLRQSIEASAENLARYVSAADGQPCSADSQTDRHQQACVLFNIMRGGIYASGDEVSSSAFADFVATRNRKQARKHRKWLTKLPRSLVYGDLVTGASKQNDRDLLRLAYEYLPLTFSRRHGDPSRPWNRFAIRVKNPDGSPLLAYEGNWRDIFQNWEALSLSYPMFIESVIAKFVNASTVDGYNPYRITREGIDWEVPNPEDAWSSMGYWGDHQIIYLLKFLEQAKQVRPKTLTSLLNENLFSYANVPLRLRPFDAVVRDPQSTMDFDHEMNKRIEAQIQKVGTDARLLHGSDGEVYHVTLVEKLLVPALSKLSNLVLDAGIWMNTQRPEWNDANNALVGNGVSMVTLCYLRRYLTFCKDLFEERGGRIDISFEVAQWLTGIVGALEAHRAVLANAKS